SRRRHTRSDRDWSSDVCSSDLPDLFARIRVTDDSNTDPAGLTALDPVIELRQTNRREFNDLDVPEELLSTLEGAAAAEDDTLFRSEERRVGKESRSRWWRSEEK